MPRLLHMADVHLGARHDDLGPAAAGQRERQFEAFQRAIEVAIDEKVDLVLVCGDLFDSNSQPRRSVERAAAELARLVERHIPVVLVPGTHDCYDAGSIYRVFNLAEMAGAADEGDMLTVLTDERSQVEFEHLGLTVRAKVYAQKRASASPLAAMVVQPDESDTIHGWHVGMAHGSFAVPGRFDADEVMFTDQEVAASNLDYLALGHWHSFREGRAGRTVWAYSGAPEPVALDQDGAGQVAIVTLDERNGERVVSVEPRTVGRSRFRKVEIDAATVTSQADLERKLRELANPDLVLDVRLLGVRNEGLDLHVDEVERQLASAFLRVRVRDASLAPLDDTIVPGTETILGAFMRDFQARIEDHESRGDAERAAELREALRLGMLLLDDPQRVTLA